MGNLYPCNMKGSGGGATVISLVVTTQPTKLDYAANTALDLTGIVVTALFSNGNTANVTNMCTFSPANGDTLATAGNQTITVTFEDVTTSLSVFVASSISVTTHPTKYVYASNDALNLSGIEITAIGGAVTKAVTSSTTFSPADGTTLTTSGINEITATWNGLTTKNYINVTSSPLEQYTWSQIKTRIQNGTLSSVASVGDTKTITLPDGFITQLQLASINDGTGSAGTYYPNHTADFISVELLNDMHNMNSTSTNAGGWNDCEMRTYLNSTIYPALPSDLRTVIIDKTHMRTAGNKSTSLVSASDKLWLPTTYEMFGQNLEWYLDDADHNIYYSIFPDTTSRKKYRLAAPTSAKGWWLSSPWINSTAHFACVDYGGYRGDYAATTSEGVALCLRIG